MNAEVQVESSYNDKRKPAEIKQSKLLRKVQDVRVQRRSKKFGVGGGGGSSTTFVGKSGNPLTTYYNDVM